MDWSLQAGIVRDLKKAASSAPGMAATQISPVLAAFYLFQCYVNEFGVIFDAVEACHWLLEAALSNDEW
jgi:hypothetical protein